VGNKIYKITKLFDRVVQLKNRGVTYRAERNLGEWAIAAHGMYESHQV